MKDLLLAQFDERLPHGRLAHMVFSRQAGLGDDLVLLVVSAGDVCEDLVVDIFFDGHCALPLIISRALY